MLCANLPAKPTTILLHITQFCSPVSHCNCSLHSSVNSVVYFTFHKTFISHSAGGLGQKTSFDLKLKNP